MKTVFKLLHDCIRYLPQHFKTRGALIILLILISTFVDLLGIATVFPLFSVFLSDKATSYPYLAKLYEWIGASDQREFLYLLMAIVVVVLVLKTIFISVSNFIQGKFIYSIYSYYVRQKYISIFLNKGDPEFKANSDDIKSDLYILPRVFANQLLISLLNLIAELFVLIIVFTFLLSYNWQVVVALLITIVPLLIIFYLSVRRKTETVDVELKNYISKIARFVSIAHFGNLDIRLSKSFHFFHDKFKKIISSESKLLNWKLTLTKIPALVVELIILFALIIMIVFNLYQDNSREELMLQVSVFGVAAIKLMPSFNRLMYAIMNIRANIYSVDIIKERVNLEELDSGHEKVTFNQNIEIANASFSYQSEKKVFDNLNIQISKGDRLGIVGESGAGKSTFLKLLLGQLQLRSGSLLVDGQEVNRHNMGSWTELIGMVSQDVFILDDTVEANIAFGQSTVDHERLKQVISLSALDEFVDALPSGLKTNMGEMGSFISGGQRQRIGIARALYHGAQVLLLDEATSSLDEKTEEIIIKSIENLPASLTIITITHRLSFLSFCNKIYELKEGSLHKVAI